MQGHDHLFFKNIFFFLMEKSTKSTISAIIIKQFQHELNHLGQSVQKWIKKNFLKAALNKFYHSILFYTANYGAK